MSELTIGDYARDFAMCATSVQDIADEVSRHIAAGEIDAAATVLGVSGGKLSELRESAGELQRQLQAAGASPQRWLDRAPGGEA